LAIPKLRRGSYFPSFLEPRKRSEQALVAVVQEAYVAGVSTRKMDQVVESLGLRRTLGILEASMPGSVLVEGDAPAMSRPRKYPDELRERAVRLVFESKRPIAHVAQDLGIHKESLRHWVRQAEADSGRRRDLLSSEEREELKRLRKENFELRRANAILKDASVYFAQELDPTRRR
jgi:transposase